MRKIIIPIILFAAMVFASTSCGNKTEANEKEIDTVWNEKVQDTFFGATFGDSASTVISKFSEHGLVLMTNVSTDVTLNFIPRNNKYYTFGNMTFEMLSVELKNNRFSGIIFFNGSKDKATAMSNYEYIKKAISAKYEITHRELKDTTVYARCSVFGRNYTNAGVDCYRSESISKEIRIYTELVYYTTKDFGGVSDEL